MSNYQGGQRCVNRKIRTNGNKATASVLKDNFFNDVYDGGYWQTVMVCQLEVIGRPYGLPTRDYWQTVYKISKRSVNNLLLADP